MYSALLWKHFLISRICRPLSAYVTKSRHACSLSQAQCKIKLPETEEDHHDFHVFTSEREMELPLRSKLRDIPCLREPATPLLLLESPIFRNEEQVEIDTRVDRIRKETYGWVRWQGNIREKELKLKLLLDLSYLGNGCPSHTGGT